ncbi:hypothetical protein HA402_005017 [Bradysia odoriphaga]|nr:hypothetical protein HA402_005017 [Bradysia odoriphaga]
MQPVVGRDNVMPINRMLIEYSSRLQVANFFILFTKRFADTKSVKILLKPSEIAIHFDGDKVLLDLTEHFQLETCSLSLLNIAGDSVSFRLNTNNENNFRFEYLSLNNNESSTDVLRLKINVKPDKDFQIICSNCTCPLTTMVNYQRILELPSENLDLSEWFCHKHHSTSDTSSSDHPINAKEKFNFAKFNPRDTDLLFGQFFFLFNTNRLTNIKTKNNFVHCRRCLNFLGETVRDSTIKIWDENIKIQSESGAQPMFDGSSMFKNFYFIIRKNVQDFDFMSSAGLPSTNKILFETKESDGSTNYLLLQIMNKNLELFTVSGFANGMVSLQKLAGMKVFYRIESDETRPMVKFWQNDVGCSNIQISRKMFTVAVDTLNEYSNFVPVAYRNMGGFTVSYLHI